jgi:hypothetical protein
LEILDFILENNKIFDDTNKKLKFIKIYEEIDAKIKRDD